MAKRIVPKRTGPKKALQITRVKKRVKKNVPGISPVVRKYAAGFQAKGLKGIDLVKAIVKDIHSFKRLEPSMKEAKATWAKRTAREIIETRTVYVKGKLAIGGCTDRAIAIGDALRSVGFNTVIVRANTHTYVKLFYKNRAWILNTLATEGSGVREMTGKNKARDRLYKKEGSYKEGKTMKELGLQDYDRDFNKYEYGSKKRR